MQMPNTFKELVIFIKIRKESFPKNVQNLIEDFLQISHPDKRQHEAITRVISSHLAGEFLEKEDELTEKIKITLSEIIDIMRV